MELAVASQPAVAESSYRVGGGGSKPAIDSAASNGAGGEME